MRNLRHLLQCLAFGLACTVLLSGCGKPTPVSVVKGFLDAAIADDTSKARSLLEGLDCWVLYFDVLSYSIKHEAGDTISVEVMFNGDQRDNQIFQKNWSASNAKVGPVAWILKFHVEEGKINSVEPNVAVQK